MGRPDLHKEGKWMMTEKEFIQMMITQRIDMLLGGKRTAKEKEVFDRGEQVMRGLEEEERMRLEEYMNQAASLEAAAEEKAYLGGFKDGICLVLEILKIGQEGCRGLLKGRGQ